MSTRTKFNSSGRLWKLAGWAVVMLAGVALFANISATGWGVLVLLLCPLMHVFMHRNMHTGLHEDRQASNSRGFEGQANETDT